MQTASQSGRVFDVVVVGRGLLGSTAARHLAESALSVCLVGPNEPDDKTNHMGVFSSHYDRGRIMRIADRNRFYAHVAAASIGRYRDIEERSGQSFFVASGHLAVTPVPKYLAAMKEPAERFDADVVVLNHAMLRDRYPLLHFDADNWGLLETGTAGHIDPRACIAAHGGLVELAGGEIVDATVTAIDSTAAHAPHVQIALDDDRHLLARKVLVATGAFANHHRLTSRPVAIEVQEHTVLLAQVDGATARALRAMPTIIAKRGDEVGESVYVLPPVLYPDGQFYIKIGQSAGHVMVNPTEQLQPWFRSTGDEAIGAWLHHELVAMLPGVEFNETHTESCATTMSPTRRPYIDQFEDAPVYSLLAGNGAVAKSADEVGRIAAHFVQTGDYPAEYADHDFTLRYSDR